MSIPVVRQYLVYIGTELNQVKDRGLNDECNPGLRQVAPQFPQERRRHHHIANFIQSNDKDPLYLGKINLLPFAALPEKPEEWLADETSHLD